MTAVEWLITELNQELNYIPITQWDRIKDLVQRAKQMEKEQKEEEYKRGWEDATSTRIKEAHKYQ